MSNSPDWGYSPSLTTLSVRGHRFSGIEQLTDVLKRLIAAGYTADFYARDGKLGCAECDDMLEPARVVIEEIVRLEGESDPDEQVVVYALSEGPCGRRGTYLPVYGPAAPDDDVVVELALKDARRR